MSLGRYYSVMCDVCGRATPTQNSGKQARADAKRLGWSRVIGKRIRRWKRKPPFDYCAECAYVRNNAAPDTQDGAKP